MQPYLSWMDAKGFFVRSRWDHDKQDWGGGGKVILEPVQREIMGEALRFDERDKLVYETILYSCVKKSGKTALAASVGAWYAEESEPGTEIYIIANTKEQGVGRVFQDLEYHFKQCILEGRFSDDKKSPYFVNVTGARIEFANGTYIQVLSQSFKASAGSRHSLTLWDELWGSCLTPDTKVLKDDLTWVPVGDLKIDDRLIAFDEEHPEGQAYRNWRRGRVVATGRNVLPVKHILMDEGPLLTATLNHKWLVRRGNHNEIQWIETQDLKKGDKLMKVIEPWETRTDYDAGYISGALDGEGSLSYEKNGGARLCFSQRPNVMWDEMDRLYEEAGVSAYDTGKTLKKYAHGFKSAKDMIITKKAQVMKILGSTRPKRLLSKFDIERFGRMTAIKWVDVLETWDDEREIVTLTTDTETYIAEGYCSHNTTELDRRMWDEMTPIPTVRNSLRFISSYAGFENESDLLWGLYLQGVGEDEHDKGKGIQIEALKEYPCYKNGKQFTYWDHDPRMPWQTDEYYESQMASERPTAFARLHMNKWVSSRETFIPVEWWDSAEKAYEADAILWADHPFIGWPCSMAVDAGVTQDCTAITVVGYDAHRAKLGLITHKIWTPMNGQPVDLDAVELRITELYNLLNIVSIRYDPTHLMQMMNRLRNKGMNCIPFEQTQTNMILASQLLFDLLRNRNLEAYPADDLKKHIQMAVAETTARGFRIVKDKVSKRHHVDGAVSLAMAAYDAVSNGGVDVSVPVQLISPFSDMTSLRSNDSNHIPFALRTED